MFPLEYAQRRKLHLFRVTTRKEIQIPRKLFHMGASSLTAFLYLHVIHSQTLALTLLGIGGGIIILLDLLRLKIPSFNRFSLRVVGSLARREEVNTPSAMISCVLASFLAIAVFPPPIAALALLLLAYSDPAASVVGILFGKERLWNGKSIQGSLACFCVSFVVILIFISNQHLVHTNFLPIALIGATATTLAELSIIKVDDNFSVPIFGGAAVWWALSFLG